MTILKNKYYVGQKAYDGIYKAHCTLNKIEEYENDLLMYRVAYLEGGYAPESRLESDLYESKEAYEAAKNEIKVGDEFYYVKTPYNIVKTKALEISSNDIMVLDIERRWLDKEWCFKSKDILLETVKKALEGAE